ncbi:Aste57867_14407 [Aphanomyces stellatus]|uniref:Aste57867_14407 protein n=1 Tax=Aphanomyces stellatus TaxID=120398 RepID=A0A485L149_9STRA|nr:hypothetical protein As57867_014353 [Aphanomyces stellatus]VFT91229.1 Aste57867_14407 [Aphanomyces stellatus]
MLQLASHHVLRRCGGAASLRQSRGLCTSAPRRRLRIVSTLEEDDLPSSSPQNKVPQAPPASRRALTPAIDARADASTLLSSSPKKKLIVRAREPKSVLDHVFKYEGASATKAALAVLERCIHHKEYEDALEAFENLPPTERTRLAYEWAMEAHLSLHNYSAATTLFLDAQRNLPMLHNTLRVHYAHALTRQRRFGDLLEAFDDWQGTDVTLTPPVFGAILVACSHIGNWSTAQRVLDAMDAAHVTPDGTHYFHLIVAAIKDPSTPVDVALDLCDAASGHGYPVAVTVLNHVLAMAAMDSRPALHAALTLWQAHKQHGRVGRRDEVPFEMALQTMWTKGYRRASVAVVEDLLELSSPSRAFKSRVARYVLVRAAAVDVALSLEILALVAAHDLGPLPVRTRHLLYDGWAKYMTVDEIAARFRTHARVTGGWNGRVISHLFENGYKHFVANNDTTHNTQTMSRHVLKLLEHAIASGETISYPALEAIVHWLVDLQHYREAYMILGAVRANPSIHMRYRLVELGMYLSKRFKDSDDVVALYEELQTSLASHRGVELKPRPFMAKLAMHAYSDTGNLMKFQELQYMLVNNEDDDDDQHRDDADVDDIPMENDDARAVDADDDDDDERRVSVTQHTEDDGMDDAHGTMQSGLPHKDQGDATTSSDPTNQARGA